ncbi:nucleotidyltransferase domain-containing protein [Palaeococcus sp. (in: euryarchaeotes)]
MIPQTHLKVLYKLYERLKDSNVNWVVTGSLGFALQGVSVEPHDIDIQTDKEGAYEIEHFFSEFVVESVRFKESEKIRSHFGALMIEGVKVEIMGDIQKKVNDEWEPPVDITKYKRFVQIEGMKIPVLSLEYEYQAYLKLGRIEKAKILKKFLEERGKDDV